MLNFKSDFIFFIPSNVSEASGSQAEDFIWTAGPKMPRSDIHHKAETS